MNVTSYHHIQQLRLRHLKKGELFKFTYDIKTKPWTKRDGTPGEQSVVYPQDQIYRRVSPRKIEPVRLGQSRRDVWERIGRQSTLGPGMLELPVTANN